MLRHDHLLADPSILDHPLLSYRQALRLVVRHKRGDRQATAELLRCNERLIFKVAVRVWTKTGRLLDFDDVHQEGRLGFLHALDLYDLDSGVKVGTYATYWIRQAAQVAVFKQGGVISLGVMHAEVIRRTRKAEDLLRPLLHRQPTDEEIAAQIDSESISAQMVGQHRALEKRLGKDAVSYMADPIDSRQHSVDAYQDTIGSRLPAPQNDILQQVAQAETARLIREVIEALPVRKARIISMYFGFSYYGGRSQAHTPGQIGDRFGLTGERARQLKAEALDAVSGGKYRQELARAMETFNEQPSQG